MEQRSGWLKRSLEQARSDIEARPDHLKPARYRSAKTTKKAAKTARRKAA